MLENSVVVKNLSKSYTGVKALDRVSFEITSGVITGFLGPNGAGKTTTMKILSGITSPDSGDVGVLGYNLRSDLSKIKRITGYLPESNPLYGELRVSEYLIFRGRIKGLSRKQARDRLDKLSELCHLSEFKDMIIKHLSKGMKQRVGIADALINDPKFLILDEPTIGLDPNQIKEIRTLLKAQAQNKIVLLSTHILGEVESICEKVVIINKGKIVASGNMKDISSAMKISNRIRVQVYGQESDIVKSEIESLKGVRQVILNKKGDITVLVIETESGVDLRSQIYTVCKQSSVVLLELSYEQLSLEEVFSAVTLR